jgi:hypothetical protein
MDDKIKKKPFQMFPFENEQTFSFISKMKKL